MLFIFITTGLASDDQGMAKLYIRHLCGHCCNSVGIRQDPIVVVVVVRRATEVGCRPIDGVPC
jgi:hypothetical protein